MADFEEDLFSVFNDVDKSKKDGKTVEVTDYDDKDSLKRIFSQRGEKRQHGECVDGNLLSTTQNDENLKKVKRQDDER